MAEVEPATSNPADADLSSFRGEGWGEETPETLYNGGDPSRLIEEVLRSSWCGVQRSAFVATSSSSGEAVTTAALWSHS
ncbi:MAG: hypothetical protein JWO14_3571 [Solirubrobacterales bacterium]|nr:hypothetical protein [Solirubrobacterales bacterium]